MMEKISVNTVQELIDHHHTVTIYCHNPKCHHKAVLDLPKIRDKLGPDHSMLFEAIRYKLRCSKCGRREFGMSSTPGRR